jgi:hypothetical protein
MLAAIALLRAQLVRVVIALFAALCLAIVLGVQPFFGIAGRLPGFDLTYLSRLTILYLLCIALLAGWGLDDLVRMRPRGGRAVAVAVKATAIFVLPIVIVFATRQSSLHFLGRAVRIALGFAPTPSPTAPHVVEIVRLAALVVWVLVAGAGVILLLLRMGRRLPPGVWAALAVVLVVGDLFQAGMGQNPAIPQSHAVQPATPAIRYLQSQRPAREVAVAPYIGVNPLPPDVNLRYGLYDGRGYDLPVVESFGQVWARYVGPPTPLLPLDTPAVPVLVLEFQPAALRILSLLGVRDILEQKSQAPLQLPGVHVAYNGPDATIYANDRALPRAWLVAAQAVVPGDKRALAALGAPGFHPRKVLITEHRLAGLAENRSEVTSPGTAHISRYEAEQVTIDAHVGRASELVLSDTYYPGWHVTVNGRPARLDRVDYMFRGVPVPAGRDRIVFTYDPASFRIGWMVSLAAALVVVAAVFVGLRRRPRPIPRHGRTRPPVTAP